WSGEWRTLWFRENYWASAILVTVFAFVVIGLLKFLLAWETHILLHEPKRKRKPRLIGRH
ncbi:MAG: hypothetical protein ABH821_01285, partial [archaeon]